MRDCTLYRIDQRPGAQWFPGWIKQEFPLIKGNQPRLFIDVTKSECQKLNTSMAPGVVNPDREVLHI